MEEGYYGEDIEIDTDEMSDEAEEIISDDDEE